LWSDCLHMFIVCCIRVEIWPRCPRRGVVARRLKLIQRQPVAALPAAGELRLDTDTLEKLIDKLNIETLNTAVEQLEVQERELENLLKLAKDKNIIRAELEVHMPKGQQHTLI
jgi:DNA replicative helicase MCM subunit Mcm2 (Cdc46/Mcm family)